MIADDDTPIGAPALPPTRRDRLSIWIADHSGASALIRVAIGLTLVAVTALVFRADMHWDKLIAFVVGVALGNTIVEHERERAESLPGDRLHGPPVRAVDSRHYRPHV
jgi:hypothetical protein